MPLEAGTSLGPYEIVGLIGAGGMGEVYKARDTRLGRDVAVKVARHQFSERFQREARVIATLNHPHICTLFDVGPDYLVMEYVDGAPLEGPLDPPEVLRLGIQIAGALEHAHGKGVVHRDLKPANILVTRTGVKLLDFGLAKLSAVTSTATGTAPATDAATLTRALTEEGAILGTPQYMAPEQVEGKEADARSDLFAFGAVLYELLAGRRAFEGKTKAGIMVSILEHEPPSLETLKPRTPPMLERVVRKCLAKKPEERWQSAHDLKEVLEWVAGAGLALPAHKTAKPWLPRLAVAAAAVFALSLLAVGLVHFRETPPEAAMVRFLLHPPAKTTLRHFALSPDGRRLAFTGIGADGKQMLWVQSLGSLSAQVLPGAEGAALPFWSPDSRFVGFFADGKLKKIDAAGGPPQTLCDALIGRGGAWSREGVIVFAPSTNSPLHRVPAAGGIATAVTALDEARGETSQRGPQFLPDGRRFLYYSRGAAGQSGTYLGSLDSKENTRILAGQGQSIFAPAGSEGHLLFVRQDTLMAQRFDPGRGKLAGEPFPVAEKVGMPTADLHGFTVSGSGTLAVLTGQNVGLSQLLWLDRGGKQVAEAAPRGVYFLPALSPDEKRIAFARGGDIWVLEWERGIASRFTFDPAPDDVPQWSSDGSRIVFSSVRGGITSDLYWKPAGGLGNEDPLLKSPGVKIPLDWSRDGRFLLYGHVNTKTGMDLEVLPLGPGPGGGERKPFVFLQSQFIERNGQFSPDGRWVAYASNDNTGRYEVYVQSFSPAAGGGGGASSGKWQISSSGGDQPRWRRDGKELFFLAPDGQLMAVEVRAGASFERGTPKALFRTRLSILALSGFEYSVSGDGQRFLLNQLAGEEAPTSLTVVLNWAAEHKR